MVFFQLANTLSKASRIVFVGYLKRHIGLIAISYAGNNVLPEGILNLVTGILEVGDCIPRPWGHILEVFQVAFCLGSSPRCVDDRDEKFCGIAVRNPPPLFIPHLLNLGSNPVFNARVYSIVI